MDVTGDDGYTLLIGSPKTFRFNTPVGYFDTINADGEAIGWSLDPDVPLQSNIVHFYIDGPVGGGGTHIGTILANLPRPDVNQHYPGNHGFKYNIPNQYRDGQQHTLYAYGLDLTGDNNKPLGGNPKTFNLRPNVATIGFEQFAPPTSNSVPIDNNPYIDGDPGTDDGLRIFPDDDVPLDPENRQRIRISAETGGTSPNLMVYFRNFDLDDPSSDPVIDEYPLGDDNRGSVEGSSAGKLYIPNGSSGCQHTTNGVACPTNARGIASVDFAVTMQPGDNFAIAASTNESDLNLVTMSGQDLISGDGTPLNSTCTPSEKVCRSRMLTVWRRLHIESDTMHQIQGNFYTGSVLPPFGTRGYEIQPGESMSILLNLSSSPWPEDDQFENGRLAFETFSFPVSGNLSSLVSITNTYDTVVFLPARAVVTLFDDDDFNGNDGTFLIGDTNDVIPSPSTYLMVHNSDDIYSNVFTHAYIRPVYDIGVSVANFAANPVDDSGEALRQLYSFDNVKTENDPEFWTIYLLNAYQGAVTHDGDPTQNQEPGGPFSGYLKVSDNDRQMGVAIFVEPSGPKECINESSLPLCDISTITAAAVADLIGADETDGGLLRRQSKFLTPTSIRKLRENIVP